MIQVAISCLLVSCQAVPASDFERMLVDCEQAVVVHSDSLEREDKCGSWEKLL